ncbi:hypothetical protein MHU86_14014 [Fragilaria crotonensis]|nr:hypothetical protein MHU86_14014 [Fragilaria crotonensis]
MDEIISHLDSTCIANGRGQELYNKQGNKVFRDIVSSYRDQYTAGTKAKRSDIVKEVYDKLINDGMKFVKERDDGRWVVLGVDEGRKKVAHRFRDQIAKKSSIKLASRIKQNPAIQINRDEMASRNHFFSMTSGESGQHNSSPTWVSASGVGNQLNRHNGLPPNYTSMQSRSHTDEHRLSRLRKEVDELLRSD